MAADGCGAQHTKSALSINTIVILIIIAIVIIMIIMIQPIVSWRRGWWGQVGQVQTLV